MTNSEVVQPHHLMRQAIIYVRQSSPGQMVNHQESLKLQYALQERPRQCGWDPNNIDVIDTDLGLTGSTATGRPGFQELVTRVTLGHIGRWLASCHCVAAARRWPSGLNATLQILFRERLENGPRRCDRALREDLRGPANLGSHASADRDVRGLDGPGVLQPGRVER